jgi:hypothetical protein
MKDIGAWLFVVIFTVTCAIFIWNLAMLGKVLAENFWGLVGFVGIIAAGGLVKLGWYKFQDHRRATAWRRKKL